MVPFLNRQVAPSVLHTYSTTHLTATQETKKLSKEDFYALIFNAKGAEAKRDILKDLSNTAKMMLEMNPDAGEGVNDVIINVMYRSEAHQTFNTFNGWKEEGFQVTKGSKCFFIWSKPRNVSKKNEEKESGKDEYTMFGLAFLYSNAQVEPLEV